MAKKPRRLDGTYSRDLLDRMVRLSNTYAWREIRRLRRLLTRERKEGMRLFDVYGIPGTNELPHEVEDFLQSLGE